MKTAGRNWKPPMSDAERETALQQLGVARRRRRKGGRPMTPLETILRLARWAALRAVRRRNALAWWDDVAQEVALLVWQAQQRGHGSGVVQFRRYAHRAVSAILGDERYAGRAQRHVPLDAAPELAASPAELAPLALWRLQRLWPGLTEPQRAGVLALVAGGGYGSLADAAAARGVCRLAAKHGQRAVLARLDLRAWEASR